MIKKVLRDLLIAIVAAAAVPGSVYFVTTRGKLGTVVKTATKLGQKVGAPILGAARLSNGRLANWAAGRGRIGRTFGRVMTGTVFPGGRSRMEAIGEAGRKAQSERTAARGSYRALPSKRMNAEALEKTSVEAIQRWVNNPAFTGEVAALRQMVLQSPSIKLSTAQREALFSGGAETPTGAPAAIPGAPLPTAAMPLPAIDRPAGGPGTGRFSAWWRSRPSVAPGVRQDSQSRLGYWLGSHYWGTGDRQWLGWGRRLVNIPTSGSPTPNGPDAPRSYPP